MANKRILFTGGGTGGHVMPLLAVVREVQKLASGYELHYMGPRKDCLTFASEQLLTHSIVTGKLRRYFAPENFVDVPFKIPFSFIQSFFIMLFMRPLLVFSKGGTGSLPVTYAARLLRIPVIIHESDTFPGTSNRISGAWAKKIFVSFEKTEMFDKDKVTVIGNPIRKELLNGNKEGAREIFHVMSEKPVILILGGSQGSETINEFVLFILHKLVKQYEIIHVAGPKNYRRARGQSKAMASAADVQQYYHLYEFLNEVQLKNAYAASDAIISRAGSSSIFEIAAVGKPSILIPLPSSAHDHQSKNAYLYEKSKAAAVMEQESLSPGLFMQVLESILEKANEMSKNALKFAKPEAAEKIANEIIKFVHEKESAKSK